VSRCRDGFCGADDCSRCRPFENERPERDPDEVHEERIHEDAEARLTEEETA